MNKFWMGWRLGRGNSFTLAEWPWWRAASQVEGAWPIVAAVIAANEHEARRIIAQAHDHPLSIGPISCVPRPADWSPFSPQFPRQPHHRWLGSVV